MFYHLFRIWTQGAHYAYENPLFRAVCAALLCFVLVLLIGPAFIRQLARYRLRDRPEFDHATLNEMTADKRNVPTMGGSLILVAVAVGVLLFADPLNFYIQMAFGCMIWLGGVGAWDDWAKLRTKPGRSTRDGLKPYQKLLFQVGLGVILGFFIYQFGGQNDALIGPADQRTRIESYRILMVPFYKPGIKLGAYLFMLVTCLVVTGTSNAVNLTDGMDGLASGCIALCCFVFMLLAYAAGNEALSAKLLIPHIPKSGELAVFSGAMMGACMGFLWYNAHPARVFMGDTGSLPLGGLIGYIAIVTRQELMLLIVGGVFVIEAVSVMMQIGYFKWTRGKRLFLIAPIHHRFHLSGWSEPQTVIRFWLLGAAFALFALTTVKLR